MGQATAVALAREGAKVAISARSQLIEETAAQIRTFIDEVCTHKRIHSALSYLTPAEFEAQYCP